MDRVPAWGGAAVDEVRDAARRALSEPSEEGERRAFALGDLTCVVEWEPAERHGGARGYQQVTIRLRRGSRQRSHATTLPSLSMLARTCEHHLLFFAWDDGPDRPAPRSMPGSTRGRSASPLSAADRLRALLHQGSHPGS